MAGVTLGFLKYVLGFDSLSFQKGITQADADLKKLQKSFAKAGEKIAGAGKTLTLGVTLPLTAFGVTAFRAASDAAELQSSFDTTFGAMAGTMNKWAEETGNALGRSTQEMQKAANTFGIFFSTAVPTQKAAAMSQTFAKLAQDLGSFFNVDTETAIEKLRSGLSGESEPLRDFGVFLTEASVKAKAMEMGLTGVGNELTEQEKILARYQLILEATGKAQGDVERTSGGTANQVRAAKAAFEELQVVIGTKLLPVITPLIGKIGEAINWFTSLPPGVQTAAVALGAFGVALGPVLVGVGGLVTAIAGAPAAVAAIATAFGGLGTVLTTLSGVVLTVSRVLIAGLFANPWILGAAAVIGGIYLAWKNWDKITGILRNLYVSVKSWLQDKLGAVFSWLGERIRWVADKFKWLDDVVVRHSYVPDMVESVGEWFAKLDPLMVGTTERAAAKTAATFQSLRDRVGGLMKELYPEVQQMAELAAKAATLRSGEAAGLLNADMAQDARRRLYGIEAEKPFTVAEVDFVDHLKVEIEDLIPQMDKLGTGAKGLSEKWEEAGYAILDIVGRLFGNSKGGKIFGAILQGGLDIARAVGVFGGKRANGGPVTGAKSYLVGERGPEIFTPSSSGRIISNDRIGGMGGTRLQVVPSKYFDLVVDGRAQAVAAPIGSRAAMAGAAGGMAGVDRRRRRAIP